MVEWLLPVGRFVFTLMRFYCRRWKGLFHRRGFVHVERRRISVFLVLAHNCNVHALPRCEGSLRGQKMKQKMRYFVYCHWLPQQSVAFLPTASWSLQSQNYTYKWLKATFSPFIFNALVLKYVSQTFCSILQAIIPIIGKRIVAYARRHRTVKKHRLWALIV